MQTGSSETLIGWKSGKTTHVPRWDRVEERGYGLRDDILLLLRGKKLFETGLNGIYHPRQLTDWLLVEVALLLIGQTVHRLNRVLGFFSCRRNWDPEGLGGPNSNEGKDTVVFYRYTRIIVNVLCGIAS
jgi:hypothetical protein